MTAKLTLNAGAGAMSYGGGSAAPACGGGRPVGNRQLEALRSGCEPDNGRDTSFTIGGSCLSGGPAYRTMVSATVSYPKGHGNADALLDRVQRRLRALSAALRESTERRGGLTRMISSAIGPTISQMTSPYVRRVQVRQRQRGNWEVQLSGQKRAVGLETLEEARRVAYLAAAHRQPCELIIHDAYHRVLKHEFIDGNEA